MNRRQRSAASRTAVAALAAAVAVTVTVALAQTPPGTTGDARRSGYHDMGPALRAMQDDDSANPAMLWVRDGEALWNRRLGAAAKACADCHGSAASMAGVAARYPAFDAQLGRPVSLEERINLCRTDRQKAEALAGGSRELLALSAYVALQSRGRPIAPPDDERLRSYVAAGEALFKRRLGQLNLSCAQCHDDNGGRRLGGALIPQAHPTAYPIYRLEWQGLGSLKRRLRGCLVGVRAEPFADDAPEYVSLELFLMRRARGMTLEAPGVRP
ncbi:MAG: sulfur oxidation c-type cytochrome SoxA [Alphaproteobacteria bacterium]|nr:sulfur oxidation c-type cytochrome SoxA [Alphaproteobacteria bacterium]